MMEPGVVVVVARCDSLASMGEASLEGKVEGAVLERTGIHEPLVEEDIGRNPCL
jgi:hypothetical protein